MKNAKIILIVVAIIAVAGGLFFVLGSGDDPLEQTSSAKSSELSQTSPQQNAQGETGEIIPGYVEYDGATLSSTNGTRVIFFHASWCPICKALEKNILEEGVPEGLTVFKANYDTDTELKKQYGITLVSSLVQIDDSEELVKKWSGSLTIQQLVDELI